MGDIFAKRNRWPDAIAAWNRALTGDGETINKTALEKKITDARGKTAVNKAQIPRSKSIRPRLVSRLHRWVVGCGVWVLGFVAASCVHPHLVLPNDQGAPLQNFNAIHLQLSSACRAVRTLTAELALSGRAGRQKLRGRVVAGFARPESMRLEGVAPFGPPAFILASSGDTTTVLLLPRDARVLRGARAEDVLGALTGVTLGAADLQAILAGCVVPAPQAVGGRLHANGWASIDLVGGATLYLQKRANAWQLRAARRAGWQIEYPLWSGSFPQSVRLQSDDPAVMVDLTAALSQVETNTDLDAAAFRVDVPSGAEPMTLDELRATGPLGAR